MIKKIKKNVDIRPINSPIMNKLNFIVSSKNLNKQGLFLKSKINTDISDTLKLFKNIKNEM